MQPTTRLHVSGYRFLVRRMEHALVRGDTRMLDDPMRAQSISLAVGGILAAVIVAVSAVLALVRPAGEVGDAAIVVVRDSGATYVRIGDVLHPVFNMASARLIAGAPADPRMIDQRAADSAHRGPQLGIPGAPENISTPLTAEESSWTVCDDAGGDTVVIAGRVADTAVASGSGVLVRPRDGGARRHICCTAADVRVWICVTPRWFAHCVWTVLHHNRSPRQYCRRYRKPRRSRLRTSPKPAHPDPGCCATIRPAAC